MKILATTDLSDDSRPVLDFAAKLVKQCQSKMYLLHLLPTQILEATSSMYSDDSVGHMPHINNYDNLRIDDSLLHITDQRTKALAKEISEQWHIPIYGKAEESVDLVQSILDFCDRHHVDMFVVGNRHHSLLSTILLGSTPEKLMRHTRIPMVIVPCDLEEE